MNYDCLCVSLDVYVAADIDIMLFGGEHISQCISRQILNWPENIGPSSWHTYIPTSPTVCIYEHLCSWLRAHLERLLQIDALYTLARKYIPQTRRWWHSSPFLQSFFIWILPFTSYACLWIYFYCFRIHSLPRVRYIYIASISYSRSSAKGVSSC